MDTQHPLHWMKALTGTVATLAATVVISFPGIAQYQYAASIFSPSGSSASRSANNTIASELDAAIKYFQEFQTFAEATTRAGLTENLNNQKQTYTIFIPTDEAFAALPENVRQDLFKPENKDKLVQLLNYHIVPGQVQVEDVEKGTLQTQAGQPLSIKLNETGDQLTLNDSSVIRSSKATSNGVVVLIDKVLLPPDF